MHLTHPSTTRVAALGLTLALTSVAQAAFTPVAINPTNYNADVVVEKTATPVLKVLTTATVDQGTNNNANTWFEVGLDPANPTIGLPAAGSTFTAQDNANYSFKMAPSYSAPNGILINAGQVTNGTFNFTTPAAYTRLSFIGSGGNGGDIIGVRVRHADNTTETSAFPCPDWFGGTSNIAYVANGRIGSPVTYGFNAQNGNNPRLYFRDMVLGNTTSPVTSVDLYYVSGPSSSHNAILAVSGATTVGGPVSPINVTGYTYDFIVEASAALPGRVVTSTVVDGTNVWATTMSMDSVTNIGNTWYERGFNYNSMGSSGPIHATRPDVLALAASSGLPPAGSVVTNAAGDRSYQLAPSYTANNAIWLGTPDSGLTNASITFNTPVTASVLSFLASAGGGQASPKIVVKHQNGVNETNVLTVFDWFNTGAAYVIGANGRVAVDTAQFANVTNNVFTPRLFGSDVIVSSASPITGVDLYYTNTGARIAIFAVSSTADAVAPVITAQPASVSTNTGVTVTFTASAIANVPITYQWQKGTNGVYVNLVNGGNISGATTTTLTVSSLSDSDEAQYRIVATTSAGSANSGAAILTVISALTDVTQPGDSIVAYQPGGGSSPGGEPVGAAINNDTGKYLNFGSGANPIGNYLGFIVTPSMGRTKVSAMRLYTANDATERDPGNVILEGSDNGGSSWTLIYSNLVTLPDTRNNYSPAITIDPLTTAMLQIKFVNTNGYSLYRWSCNRTKAGSSIMQIGEVELLGVADTSGKPSFSIQPLDVAVITGNSATLTATAIGTPAPYVFWFKSTGNTSVRLADGGNVSGSQTASLTINPANFADASDYFVVATNTSGASTSSIARLTVLSSLTDVTTPGDTITGFGDASGLYDGNPPSAAIDDSNVTQHRNGGHGINAANPFPPFEGPVGLVITPSVGTTRVTGLRIYTAVDQAGIDPADFTLEGSNDNGAHYTTISAGPLNLPSARANNAQIFDPTVQPLQEVLFANSQSYASYRLTFNNPKADVNTVTSIQIGEIELLGVAAAPAPQLTITAGAGGNLTIASSLPGALQSTTNLTTPIWKDEGAINGSVVITPNAGIPVKFYRVVVTTP